MRILLTVILLSLVSSGWAASPASRMAARLHSIHLTFSAGSAGEGYGIVYLLVTGTVMESQLSTLDAIQVVAPTTGVERLTSGHSHWQIITQESFVDLVTLTSFKYEMRFYPLKAVGPYANGLHTVLPDSQPDKVIRVENPDGSHSFNRLRLTEIANGESQETLFAFSETNGTENWSCTTENGAKTTILSKTWNKKRTARTEVRSFFEGKKLLGAVRTLYTEFPWGEAKTEETSDPGTSWSKTSSWTYWDQPADNGYGRVKQWVDGSGYWEHYEYDKNSFLQKTVGQLLEAPAGTAANQSVEDVIERPNPYITITIHRRRGREVSRSYVAFEGDIRRDEESTVPGAPLGDPSNEITVTTYTAIGNGKFANLWTPEIQATKISDAISQCDSVVIGKFLTFGTTWADQFGVTYHENAAFQVEENLRGDLAGTRNVRFTVRPRPASAKTVSPNPAREYFLFLRDGDARKGNQVLKYLEVTPERKQEMKRALLPYRVPLGPRTFDHARPDPGFRFR